MKSKDEEYHNSGILLYGWPLNPGPYLEDDSSLPDLETHNYITLLPGWEPSAAPWADHGDQVFHEASFEAPKCDLIEEGM